MDPVTAHVVIDRPREEVFDYLSDIANHAEFSDHYLKHWRLTRVEVATETEPAFPTDRIFEALTRRRGWTKRRVGKALRRLQAILEEGLDRGKRATVGGL